MRNEARELIAFYLDAGVDCAVGEEPVDRFADEPRTVPSAESAVADGETVPVTPRSRPAHPDSADRLRRPGSSSSGQAETARPAPPPPAAPEAAIMAARESASSAKDLEELRALLAGFAGCTLAATATQLVFADGNPRSRVMFVGEAPGRDEDIAGVPFVGRSGKLLDLMLAAIGLDRTKVYIANVVPWRRPATGHRHRRKPPSACPSFTGRSSLPIPISSSVSGSRQRKRCLRPKKESPKRGGAGSNTTPEAVGSGRSPPFTRPFCCVARCRSGSPGVIFWR
jgi:Uracil DNA glycosylase superfamily